MPRVAALGAVTALLGAACGSASPSGQASFDFFTGRVDAAGQGTPVATTVGPSWAGLFDRPGLQITFSLGVSAAQLQHMVDSTGGSLTAAQANALTTGSLVVDLHSRDGAPLSKLVGTSASGDEAEDMALRIGADTPVEFREIGTTAYLRVQASQLLSDVGEAPAGAASFQSTLNRADAFLPGLAALGQGRWVSTDLDALRKAVPAAGAAPDPAAMEQFRQAFGAAFAASTHWASDGTEAGRQHFTATVDVRPLVDALIDAEGRAAGTAVPGLAGQLSALRARIDAGIPAGTTTRVEVYATGGTVEEVDLDLKQFSAQIPAALPVRMVFGPGAAVVAPAGATSIDLATLLGPMLKKLHSSSL